MVKIDDVGGDGGDMGMEIGDVVKTDDVVDIGDVVVGL